MPPIKGPTGQLSSTTAVAGWQAFADEAERVPELAWPASVAVFERMLTDSQVDALFTGTFLPLLDFTWWVEPGDAEPGMAEALAADLGLPLGEPPDDHDDPPGPGLYRFNFLEHLAEALLAMAFGHYYFEQVGEVDGGLWHLRKLGAMHPATIAEFDVAEDGGLRAVRQHGIVTARRGRTWYAGMAPPIPVDRLVGYLWRPDARRRWTGRSAFRSIYREWLIKDRLMRVDAINHERAGGVPYVETDERYQGTSLEDLQELASEFRVGEDAGAAMPPGAYLKLARAGGTDVVGSMRYHDEAMARAWGSMVRQLGQTETGSRALGQTFEEMEAAARRAVARWFRMTFREHVIQDWWAWNVGEGLPHPTLAYRPPGQRAASSQPPEAEEGGGPPRVAARRPSPRRDRGGAVRAEARLPDRPLRRQLNAGELRAAVDFAALDLAYEDAGAALEDVFLRGVVPAQVEALADAIAFTKAGTRRQRVTRADLARIEAPVLGVEELKARLLDAARAGAQTALAEAAAQGMDLDLPADDVLAALVADQAQAVAVQAADGISLSAARKAVQLAQGRTADEVAEAVVAHLQGLKHAWTVDQLHGAVQAAINAGRFEVMGQAPEEAVDRFQASELLDAATCGPCAAVDGREWASLAEAQREYPTGGYVDCEGGPRCRGTVVAVYDEL